MKTLAASSVLIGMLLSASVGFARDRLVVVIAAAGDATMTDNLTEVAIAKLAERGEFELVGTRELRRRLPEGKLDRELATCFSTERCRAELGKAAGASRAVFGEVVALPNAYSIRLTLEDLHSATVEARVVDAAADVQELVVSLQEGVTELFAPEEREEKTPEQTAVAPSTAPAPSGSPLQRAPVRAELRSKQRRPLPERSDARLKAAAARNEDREPPSSLLFVAYGAAALAVISFSAAALTGSIANAPATGATRAAAQRDLERRGDYARVANGLWIAGGALSAASAVAFVWRFR